VPRINLRDLAVETSKREGGAVNLPIAQILEVQRHTLNGLSEYSMYDAILTVNHRRVIEDRLPKSALVKIRKILEEEKEVY